MMRIIFDARLTVTDPSKRDGYFFYGIGRYGMELLKAFSQLHPVTALICDKEQAKLLPKNVPYVMLQAPFSPRDLWLPFQLNRLHADVVFSPVSWVLGWGRRYKLIVTLHDLIPYEYPEPLRSGNPAHELLWWTISHSLWPQRLFLRGVDHIVTVSEISKQAIEAANLTNKPLHVIPNAALVRKDAQVVNHSYKKELLYVGRFDHYKNVELLLRAMPLLPDYTLHLASYILPQRQAELAKLVHNPPQVKFWNGITETEYTRLLKQASP